MNRTLLLLVVLCLPFAKVFSLPVDLTTNWEISKSWVPPVQDSESKWFPIKTLPNNDILPNLELPEQGLRRITMKREFTLSESDWAEADADAFSVHLPYVSNVYRIYLNGQLIREEGKIENETITENAYRRHIIVRLPRKYLSRGQNKIRVFIASRQGEEITIYKVFNDFPASVDLYSNHKRIENEIISYMLLFLYFFVGLYHALFYYKRPKEKYNLYFALFSITVSIYMFIRSQGIYQFGLDPFTITKIEYLDLFFIPALLIMFLGDFFFATIGKLGKFTLYYVSVLAVAQLFVTTSLSYKILLLWQLSSLVFAGFMVYLMAKAVRKGSQQAKRLVAGFCVLIFTGVWDLLGATGLLPIQNLNLMRFGFLSFVLGIAAVLANRFLNLHKEVEELNSSLERKVEERTRELQESLEEIQTLKTQQDGDYFLTALLLEPLSSKIHSSEHIFIEAYTKQKKEFEFKDKRMEIGGDIIITEWIELNGKRCLAFINGDAMGKSIQGAGGALVLGVVFQSVIKRTQNRKDQSGKFPEKWIKDCFLELQAIFESFDGSMLMSGVLGLVEEDTGMLYFINAEHPWTVLYRDGVASFLEEGMELRKIGTQIQSKEVRVKTFPLEQGDVIFIGSDGRDDIVLEKDEVAGTRVINEDENQFLKRIEESKGNLQDVVDRLQKFGEWSDDLSLLRLEWKTSALRLTDLKEFNLEDGTIFPDQAHQELLEEGKIKDAYNRLLTILEENKGSVAEKFLHRFAVKLTVRAKMHSETSQHLEQILDAFPEDNELQLLLSLSYRRMRRWKDAIDLGERIRLRDPYNVRNLIQLADSYRIYGSTERAQEIIGYIEDLEPDHPQLAKLKEILA